MRAVKIIISFLFIFFIFGENLYSCGLKRERECIEGITIFCPENFVSIIRELRPVFKRVYPGYTIYAPEASDLENIYDITHFKKNPDVLILSDDSLIRGFLSAYIDWYIIFAGDRIVLAFTEDSRYSSLVDENNWYEIVSKSGVRLARANERISTLGYRTSMVLDLAKDYYQEDLNKLYKNFLPQNIFSSEKELNFLLLTGDLDYIFSYLSTAKKCKFRYIILPDQIDLGSEEFEEDYAQAEITIGKNILRGSPSRYVITIPNNVTSPERGLKFLTTIFGREGREILKNHGFQVTERHLQIINSSSDLLESVKKILGETKDE